MFLPSSTLIWGGGAPQMFPFTQTVASALPPNTYTQEGQGPPVARPRVDGEFPQSWLLSLFTPHSIWSRHSHLIIWTDEDFGLKGAGSL